jgi:hypothetical protein
MVSTATTSTCWRKKQVGRTTNMPDIVTAMPLADKGINN